MHPPLDRVGTALVINAQGEVVEARTYRQHQCDPEKMEEWRVSQETQRVLHQHFLERQEHAWEAAWGRECPKCGVKPRARCENLNERKRGKVKETVWPHQERLPDDYAPPPGPDIEEGQEL